MARKVSLWWGRGFWVETVADGDGSYHLVIRTPDFQTREQADQAERYFQQLFTTGI